jgi:putative hydrolase of the HAD superfamily
LSPSHTFRWIAFDAVGTVIHPTPSAGEVYYEAARRFGSRLARDEISRRFKVAFRETERPRAAADLARLLATSEVRERERWQDIVAAVIDDVSDSAACFAELFAHFARPQAWTSFDEVPATLAWLKAHGFGVALASNFDSRLHSVCNGLEALRLVDLRIISSEVGCRKPGRAFFDALVARTGCAPGEVLMVGDDLSNDIEGARQAGLGAVLINRRGERGPGAIQNLSELIKLLSNAQPG